MKRPNLIFVVALLVIGSTHFSATHAADRPNLLVVMSDDMGYGDLQCMGSRLLRTPNLDALAASGVLCTQAYVTSPVCSPSRAGFLTGRDPRRFGYEGNLNQSATNYATRVELLGLPPGEHTLGDHFRFSGYATALIGKWHQGTGDGFHPNQRGFDHFCGMLGGSHGYFPKANHKIERNGQPVETFSSPYLTDFFTFEALDWIEKQDEQKPWFMFLSYNAPHGPLQATDADLAEFTHIEDKKRRIYAAMMWAGIDRGVGRLRDRLKETNQLENTFIVFLSDNGGATGNASWNGPLSGVKGCLKEGGVRVPMVWSWPGTLKPSVYAAPVSSLDILPTFLAAAGAKPLPLAAPRSHEDKRNRERAVKRFGEYDGINLLEILRDQTDAPLRTLFWRLQGQAAVLDGEDKLIRLSHRPAQMFRPSVDLAEASDLRTGERERFDSLFRKLGDWEATLPTVPLWGSSPYWIGESAKHYDEWGVREEPR